MKKSILFLLVLAAIGIISVGCTQKEPAEEDGVVRDNSDPDAAKVIESDFIISFQCEFSALDRMEEDTYLSGKAYRLEARLKDGAVKGNYHSYGGDDAEKEFLFAADHSFLYKLQDVVAKYDLAQYNGTDLFVSGLPEMYGASLRIVYASGERISASDNQDCFLPLEAMEELESLFRQQLPKPPASDDAAEE